MPVTFRTVRLLLRSVNYVSLLVLARTLYHCISSSPYNLGEIHPDLPTALTRLFTLICCTLLWTILTFLDPAPRLPSPLPLSCSPLPPFNGAISVDEAEEEEGGLIFERTDVETFLGWTFALLWSVSLKDLISIIHLCDLIQSSSIVRTLLVTSAGLVVATVIALHLQLCVSIETYAWRYGWRELRGRQFWSRRMGWWTILIQLPASEEPEDDVEKGCS